MNCIAACQRQDDLTLVSDKHGTRESIGGCLDVQQHLHFFNQFGIVQSQSPIRSPLIPRYEDRAKP